MRSGRRWAGLQSALGSRAREMRDEGDEEGRRAREKKKFEEERRKRRSRRERDREKMN